MMPVDSGYTWGPDAPSAQPDELRPGARPQSSGGTAPGMRTHLFRGFSL